MPLSSTWPPDRSLWEPGQFWKAAAMGAGSQESRLWGPGAPGQAGMNDEGGEGGDDWVLPGTRSLPGSG